MMRFFSKVESLATHVKHYVDYRISSAKRNVAEKVSAIAANLIAAIITGIAIVLFVVFASTALAYALAGLTGKISTGFLIVAGIYLFATIIMWFKKETILRLPILKSILKFLFREDKRK